MENAKMKNAKKLGDKIVRKVAKVVDWEQEFIQLNTERWPGQFVIQIGRGGFLKPKSPGCYQQSYKYQKNIGITLPRPAFWEVISTKKGLDMTVDLLSKSIIDDYFTLSPDKITNWTFIDNSQDEYLSKLAQEMSAHMASLGIC